jgi:hypothetical protein
MIKQYNPRDDGFGKQAAREYARMACAVMLIAANDSLVYQGRRTIMAAVNASDLALGRRIYSAGCTDIYARVQLGLDHAKGVPPRSTRAPWLDSEYDPAGKHSYEDDPTDTLPDTAPVPVQPKPETTTMNKPSIIKIETRVFINDTPAKDFTVDQLYVKIKEQQTAIADLSTIEPQPKRLAAEIEARKAGVQALVDYIDSLPA